jgi:hypothetical protein
LIDMTRATFDDLVLAISSFFILAGLPGAARDYFTILL